MGISDDPVSVEDTIRPFEWLTNASSLKPLLVDILPFSHSSKRRALHVGCGSSTLGEYLVQELDYDQVVNIDKDGTTLRQMEHRWRQQQHDDERSTFFEVDLVNQQIPYPSGYFDVAIDKSTLDCTLCSDEATAALLCQVYRCLNAERGVYVVISFHHIDLLLPLLRDCPGTDWNVEHRVIRREVEDVVGNTTASNKSVPIVTSDLPSPDETRE
jgi:spermidine synthase